MGGGEERAHNFPLPVEVGVGNDRRARNPAAGTACELPCSGPRAPHNGSDLVEGYGEHVVQHERESLGGSQPFEHHQHREAD